MTELTKRKIQKTIDENRHRLALAACPYDPLSGAGSDVVVRIPVQIADAPEGSTSLYLPRSMMSVPIMQHIKEAGSLAGALTRVGLDADIDNLTDIWQEFIRLRCHHDFEFWAASFIIIKDKLSGQDIPFILNRGQRKLLSVFERERLAARPIRIILLKARQWGGSTLSQIYIAWLQLVHHKQWNSTICAHVENAARIVRGMYTKLLDNYPLWLLDDDNATRSDIVMTPFEGSQKTRYVRSRDCKITIGSAEKPENQRGDDITCAHLSEVGLWAETKGKKPEDLVQTIVSGIAMIPDSIIVYESTAKGVGNFFHREWLRASQKDSLSAFVPVFVAWFDIDIYAEPIDDLPDFIRSLTPDEWQMFADGATLEGINWYRRKSLEYNDHWRFVSEYPSTPAEAFQSSGHPFYNLEDVQRLGQNARPPKFVGELSAFDPYGTARALCGIKFKKDPRGNLQVWKKPDTEQRVSERYVCVMDIGGMSQLSDRSVICVLDRYWMAQGGVPEVVAEWCGHIAHYRLAWIAAQIATWYHNALLIIESNTFESHRTEGQHNEFILDEIARFYPNLFCRTSPEQIAQGVPSRWGFHTNRSTKTMVCDHQRKALENDLYVERSEQAVFEHQTLEIKPNGEIGATEGCHDDRHITRAIGVWACYQHLRPPVVIDPRSDRQKTWSHPVIGYSSF